MEKCLWILLNINFKRDLELLYGKGSTIDIFEVKQCTTNKQFIVNCKLNVGNPDLFSDVGEEGLNHLISEAWRFTGLEKDYFILSASYDVTP